ncbi:alpha-N-acetylglucosaminidase [Uranotaenia lowii]|uniref:alpha-N-acetylglucosaminidase n=1 Tax=Uranotaenia lowii TaxID=190385 RepID=UPI0024790272|nr:alpha-N-acetylglucosaminidase [Uranotaenia lowii]
MRSVTFGVIFIFVTLLLLGGSASCNDDPSRFDEHILKYVRSETTEEVQQRAVSELIVRLLPERVDEFKVIVDSSLKRNSFKINKQKELDKVLITGSSGVAAAKGLYHYLKYFCGCHISWDGDQLDLPDVLPNADITIEATSSIVYYQNVCTWSYSFTWWTWKDWRRHIDWMALQGITLGLAPFQEDIWTEIYEEYNLTQHDIDAHLSGPGFFAWQRMGNIRGWGGPLTENFKRFSSALQKQIIREMRRFGMTLALPAFAGHLPVAFRDLFPNASLSSVDIWNGFPAQYASPLFLDPVDPLFREIGKKFLEKSIARYGTDHIYFSDPFNEVQPRSNSAKYLANAAAGIYQTMAEADPLAVWLLQGWMFVKNPFWSDRMIRSFMTAVPIGRMLVLDLQSEQFPQYIRTQSYHGQPFVWCTLSNFGGTLGMFGSMDLVFERMRLAMSNENFTMIGTGITPEGINQNYALYELTLELGWNPEIASVEDWIVTYVRNRYGGDYAAAIDAWKIFLRTVYSFRGLELMRGKYTFNRRPSLKIQPWVWYNVTDFKQGVELLLSTNATNNLFKRDVVDATRQFLQNIADRIYLNVIDSYKSRRPMSLQKFSQLFQDLLKDIDRLLRTYEHFLLGRWLASARSLGQTSLEKQKYEYNARNQITLWGPQGQIVDYANKQWAGVVKDFFLERWRLFFNELENALSTNGTVNDTKLRDKIFRTVELPFVTDNKRYPVKAEGDALVVALGIFQKWTQLDCDLKELPVSAPVGKKKVRKLPNE